MSDNRCAKHEGCKGCRFMEKGWSLEEGTQGPPGVLGNPHPWRCKVKSGKYNRYLLLGGRISGRSYERASGIFFFIDLVTL